MVPGQELAAVTKGAQTSLRKASGLQHHICPFEAAWPLLLAVRLIAALCGQLPRRSRWVKPLGWFSSAVIAWPWGHRRRTRSGTVRVSGAGGEQV